MRADCGSGRLPRGASMMRHRPLTATSRRQLHGVGWREIRGHAGGREVRGKVAVIQVQFIVGKTELNACMRGYGGGSGGTQRHLQMAMRRRDEYLPGIMRKTLSTANRLSD